MSDIVEAIANWSVADADANPRKTWELMADAYDEVVRLRAENAKLREALHKLKRTGELSAAIMRDAQRTGGWEGAERVARAFERMGSVADAALATPTQEPPR